MSILAMILPSITFPLSLALSKQLRTGELLFFEGLRQTADLPFISFCVKVIRIEATESSKWTILEWGNDVLYTASKSHRCSKCGEFRKQYWTCDYQWYHGSNDICQMAKSQVLLRLAQLCMVDTVCLRGATTSWAVPECPLDTGLRRSAIDHFARLSNYLPLQRTQCLV